MYCDVKGIVTFGVGNVIDSHHMMPPRHTRALKVPWQVKGTGVTASPTEVQTAHENCVKRYSELKTLAKPLWDATQYKDSTNLYVSPASFETYFKGRLDSRDSEWSNALPGWEYLPADAQFAILLLGYAVGSPGTFKNHWPNYWNALVQQDFREAAIHGKVDGKDTATRRWKHTVLRYMFTNAATCIETSEDRTQVWWPEMWTYDWDLEEWFGEEMSSVSPRG
jgi:hypothetical protein